MANRKYYYFTEGQCEEKLVKALKLKPALLAPGKVKIFNVVQNVIPISILMTIEPGSAAVLVFDTDKGETDHLKSNINLLKKRCSGVEVLTILQVFNFEDEIERATDVKCAENLTKSKTVDDFKSTVNRMKEAEFRRTLERHQLNMNDLWEKEPPALFQFLSQDSKKIKI
ncbi:MAG: hypothetical protein SOT60_12445 [Bilifractor sp.]|nr:hypothetical protein [Bilifractor sp.]